MLDEARALLERAERAAILTRRAAQGEIGTLRVGYCSSAREHILPGVIRLMRERYPAIGLDLRELAQRAQLEMLDVARLHRNQAAYLYPRDAV